MSEMKQSQLLWISDITRVAIATVTLFPARKAGMAESKRGTCCLAEAPLQGRARLVHSVRRLPASTHVNGIKGTLPWHSSVNFTVSMLDPLQKILAHIDFIWEERIVNSMQIEVCWISSVFQGIPTHRQRALCRPCTRTTLCHAT